MKMPKLIKSKVERAEAELDTVLKEAACLSESIAALADVERTSEDADEIRRAMGERIAANNRLAKLDPKIRSARDNVAAAQAAQREALRGKLLADLDAKARTLLTVAKSCRAEFDGFTSAREALAANGFHPDYASAPIFPTIGSSVLVATELLELFASHLNSWAKQGAQLTPPAPVPPAAQPPQLAPPPKPASPAPEQEIPLASARPIREPIRDERADGMVRVIFCRMGYEHGGRQFAAGDIAAFPPDLATRLMENGAADLLQEDAE